MTAELHESGPARVLVVDDAEEIRLLLSITLAGDGRFEVVGEAADGLAALEKAAATRPDLVVLDQTMPGPSGLEVLPDLLRVAPSAAVVIYTAGVVPLRRDAVAAGAADVIDKLTVGAELAERLASIVEARRTGARVIDLDARPEREEERIRPSVR